ncbi:MAG TPA: NAD(P)/FAD-dependent oxidoreductase [Myxococcota bacterium]|nr:NAD(P)/FAD-dependent oxidoreductase [Myxococcota bacterium]
MPGGADIVVIGAGPAGSVAALEAARAGLGKILLLEKADLGRPKPCGGGISPGARKVLRDLGLWEQIEPRTYPISGLRLVSPSGAEIRISGGETASVLNRSELDRILVEAAVDAGVLFRPRKTVSGLILKSDRVVGVRLGDATIEARWVILAGGALPGRALRFQRARTMSTCLARFEDLPFDPHMVEMIYDTELLPGYGWLFPESAARVNIGICLPSRKLAGRSTRSIFESFMRRHFGKRLASAKRIGQLRGHPISTCAWIRHPAPPGVLVVGEACGLVNPATGEGILYAMQSARLAVRALTTGTHRNFNATGTAALYLGSLRRAFGARLLAAELFTRLGVGALDAVAWLGEFPLVKRLCGLTMSRL